MQQEEDYTNILNLIEGSKRGYKNCPSCLRSVPARQKQCECEHVFQLNEEKTISQEAGRGKKQCKCGAYIGVRNHICPSCNSKFEPKEKKLIQEDVKPAVYVGGRIIYTPAGECVVKLNSCNKEDVYDWCEELIDIGRITGITYHQDAMIYWLRDFFDIHGTNFKIAKQHVLDWASQYQCVQSQREQEDILSILETVNVTSVEKNSPSHPGLHKIKDIRL